ncbi:hypothetical protein GMOD_00005771 [Pyrenophora seminiperda CCB06]|uniref:Uncharacterized protein n=1 Tax=Pyrenophora seminiperda CCB06 TaxID=1302712 RepID=A0A3M7M9R0_9PLEO|nr:hypothetical protein GMOD_00005771 [Pyrenophora seminiperda CCB06]
MTFTGKHAGNNDGVVGCIICAKLGRTLDCCKALHGPCPLCVQFHELCQQLEQYDIPWRASSDDDNKQIKTLQEMSDEIESLKQQVKRIDAEVKKLEEVLEEKKKMLKSSEEQLNAGDVRLEFIIKEKKKGNKGKKGRKN